MTEYQRAVRMLAQQPRKVAAEKTSFVKHFIYVGKEKMFSILTYDEIIM
jgi:hypothetical protein